MQRREQQVWVNERECDIAGQDPKVIKRLANRLQKIANECGELGITIFGGSGTGSLRGFDGNRQRGLGGRMLILADIGGNFDGGDGGCTPDEDGLMRGE